LKYIFLLLAFFSFPSLAGELEEVKKPLEIYSSQVYKKGTKWFIHIRGYKNRKCGNPEIFRWQRSNNVTHIVAKETGTDTDPGPIDHSWELEVVDEPGTWVMDTVIRYPCPEGFRTVNFITNTFTIK
jgi:hypothetical protein